MRLTGKIVGYLRPEIELSLKAEDGSIETKSFLVDTGCTVEVVMPQVEIATLGWESTQETVTIHPAFGSAMDADTFHGVLLFQGTPRPVIVVSIGTDRIIGMALLQAWQLCMDIESPDQGEVRLQPLAD